MPHIDYYCSPRCRICMIMCLVFPIGTCYFCRLLKIAKGQAAETLTVDNIAKLYDDLTAMQQPAELCGRINGTYDNDKSSCTVVLPEVPAELSDSFSAFLEDTPEQLCAQLDGNFANGNCVLDTSQWAQGVLDVRQAACGSLGGQWANANCALPM